LDIFFLFSGVSVINVFTGKTQAYDLFSLPAISMNLSKMAEQSMSPDANLEQELIAADIINQPTNIIAHLLFMGFVATVGFKIAQLGIMLVRPIKVKLIGKAVNETQTN
jgi:hypothetical protein